MTTTNTAEDPVHAITGDEDCFVPSTNLDRYGFSYILAAYTGLAHPRRPFCSWVHGWVWWEDVMAAEDLIGPRAFHRDLSLIVGTPREKQVLLNAGYSKVVTGGLPFIYVKPQSVKRNPNALLAFMAHSSEAESHQVLHLEYLDQLAALRRDFEEIYVSVFALDSSDRLAGEIQRRGLHVLRGANPVDKSSMFRTRRALEYFGHVSANTMGSPIAYALATGCAVSLATPLFQYDYRVFAGSGAGFSKEYVERLEYVHSEPYLRTRFPQLIGAAPTQGVTDQELGLQMVGSSHKLAPREVLAAVGWTFPEQANGYLTGALRRSRRHLHAILHKAR